MSNPTSNFGWQMPTNTDLVSQLPADFEVFGQAVDTSLADLKGGTTGQVLKKNSNTDMDFVWSADAGMTNPMTTTGDTIYSSSGSTPARLGIGTTGQVLTVSGGVPVWAAPAGGGKTYTLLSTVSASAVTSLSFTGLSGRDSYCLMWQGVWWNSFGNDFRIRLNNNSNGNYNMVRQGKDNNYPLGSATNSAFFIAYTGASSNVPTNGAVFIEGGNGTGGKTFDCTANVADGVTGAGLVPINVAGICNLGATITSIDLPWTSTWSSGTFYLWGA